MDEEEELENEKEELENMLIGRNQRRTNRRPEEIQAERQNALPDKRSGVEKLLDESLTPKEAIASGALAAFGAKTSVPFLSRGAAFLGMPKFAAFTGGYALGNAIDNNLNISGGLAKAYESASGGVDQPAFTAAPTLQALADQKAQGAMTEDDKVDNLQRALQSVPDTPQVVPGTLPTAQEAGQRLIDAAKEFYPGAFPAEAPAAPAVPEVPAAPAIPAAPVAPAVPESVTSAEVPAGLGPMRPVNPRTGEFLSPEVIAAGERAGFTFPSQVALPQAQAPVPIAPMGEAETRARLQQRFGAPTINQLQALAPDQGQASLERQQRIGGTGSFEDDSQALQDRIADRDRRPGESQAERDTRISQDIAQQSISAAGRRFTDFELRRAFGDGYEEARIKDMNGINPFTDLTYEQEKLNRENIIADTENRKKSGVEDSPTKIIEDAKAQAEAIAELYGLTPGTPEYDQYVRSAVTEKLGFPEYFKPKTYTEDEANAAYERGELRKGQEYTAPNGEIRVYTGPDEETESNLTGKRSARLNKQIEEDKREQEQKEAREEQAKKDNRAKGRN